MLDEDASIVLTAGDLTVEVRPDRGLDIGSVTYLGRELSWLAPHRPGGGGGGDSWLRAFQGGLLVTCGLHNVGRSSESRGLHGEFTHVPAERVEVDHRTTGPRATGVVVDDGLVCARTIELQADRPGLSVTDVVENTRDDAVQAPMLYHVNLGGDIVFDRMRVEGVVTTSVRNEPEADGWSSWQEPGSAPPGAEFVWEHVLSRPWMIVRDPLSRLGVRVSWTGLDRTHQWVDARDRWRVVSIEPANCSVLGREHDRATGRAPMLEPGERRVTQLSVEVLTW